MLKFDYFVLNTNFVLYFVLNTKNLIIKYNHLKQSSKTSKIEKNNFYFYNRNTDKAYTVTK